MELSRFYERANSVHSNPAKRLHRSTYELIQRNNFVVDCHCHLFPRTTLDLDYILLRLPDMIKGVVKDADSFDKAINKVCFFAKNAANLLKWKGISDEDLNSIRNFCERRKRESFPEAEVLESELQEVVSEEFEREFWELVDSVPLTAEELKVSDVGMLEGVSTEEIHKEKKRVKLMKMINLFVDILGFMTVDQVYEYYASNFLLGKSKHLEKELETLIVVPMMDIESSMGWKNSKVELPFELAVQEYLETSRKLPILPFFAVHPDRENLLEQFLAAFEPTKDSNGVEQSTFFGLKVYPALGYHPADYRLMPIYKVCAEKGIPVMTHCGGAMVTSLQEELDVFPYDPEASDIETGTFVGKKVHMSGKEGEIPEEFKDAPILGLANKLNAPELWAPVLEAFPNLKLNLAHFGGSSNWEVLHQDNQKKNRVYGVIRLMEKYEGVYADFSYNIIEDSPSINGNFLDKVINEDIVRDRSLYGTDFWVAMPIGDLAKSQEGFIRQFSRYFSELSIENPIKFLDLPTKTLAGVENVIKM